MTFEALLEYPRVHRGRDNKLIKENTTVIIWIPYSNVRVYTYNNMFYLHRQQSNNGTARGAVYMPRIRDNRTRAPQLLYIISCYTTSGE